MIRTFIYGLILAGFVITSCNPGAKPTDTETAQEQVDTFKEALSVTQLLQIAELYVDSAIMVKGTVTHTCKHSGKRCFIVDSIDNQSIRIEAKGNIGGFNKELVGTEICVNGILREKRLEKSYIDEWEVKTLAEKEKAEDGGTHCNAELTNIKEMREWMKAHNKNYYSVYFIDGHDFEEIE